MNPRPLLAASALAIIALTAACSESNTGRLSLGFASRPATSGGALSLAAAGDSAVFTFGNDTIILRSVEIVLREIELKPLEDVAGCMDSEAEGEHDDECEEIETGPMLVDVGLGGSVEHAITVDIPAGTFDQMEFKIHKPEDHSAEDLAFIAAHPDFASISLRVRGTYSAAGARTDFTFTSDLDAEQEIELDPPLVVAADGAVNVTIRFDIGRWFVNAPRTALVNPATALAGGANENLVRDNIRASIRAFRDDNHDGDDDDHEGDDDGGEGHGGDDH
jgi:hypothetical protein